MLVRRTLAYLAVLLAACPLPAQATQDFGGLTLADVRRLTQVELARRVDPIAGPGFHLDSVNMHRVATSFIFVSPVRAVARGVCRMLRLRVDTNPASGRAWRVDPNVQVAVPPEDWWTAPLMIERRDEQTTFHLLPARPSLRRTRQACTKLPLGAGFFAAPDAAAAQRAAAILTAFRRRMATNPSSVRANCGGRSTCREQLAALSVHDFASFEECGDPSLAPDLACAIFRPAAVETMGFYSFQSYRLETTATPIPGALRRLTYESPGVMID